MKTAVMCACTGTRCEGSCRDTHLYRKRKTIDSVCPAAYGDIDRERVYELDKIVKEKQNGKT